MSQNHLLGRRTMMMSLFASPASRTHAGEMAEDREFFVARMGDAKPFLIAGEIAATAGVNQVARAEIMNFPVGIATPRR